MPRLVVAMPAYNAAATVKKSVITTLRAMPADSELIVCDDRSTDGTLELLDSLSDRRLKIIANNENIGNGGTRRRLMEESDSEIFGAMDADDIAFPWRFALQLRAIRKVDVVFGSGIRFGEAPAGGSYRIARRAGQFRLSLPTALHPEEMPAALLFHCPVWQSSLLARRPALEKVGGYQPLRYGQDYELFLRLADSGARMHRVGAPVFAYRESPQQVTRRDDYLNAIRGSEELFKSYNALFMSRAKLANSTCEIEGPTPSLADVEAGLKSQLRFFRPVNRPYYLNLLRSGRSQAWLKQRFPNLGLGSPPQPSDSA